MFIIHTWSASRAAAVPFVQGLVRSQGALKLKSGISSGEIIFPAVSPRLSRKWRGVHFAPDEAGVSVALRNPDDSYYYYFDGQDWICSYQLPQYMPVDALRLGLAIWPFAIQLRLRFVDPASRISEVKLGYEVELDPIDYLLKFVLPRRFASPVTIERRITLESDLIDLPTGFDSLRVGNPEIMTLPGKVKSACSVTPNGQLAIAQAGLYPSSGQLVFQYECLISSVGTGDFYQISETPTILLQVLPDESSRQAPMQDFVVTSQAKAIVWHGRRLVDVPIEVTVVAESDADCRQICNHLIADIRQNASLDAPAFGGTLIIKMQRAAMPGPGIVGEEMAAGGLQSYSFRFLLSNFIHESYCEEVDLIQSSALVIQNSEVGSHSSTSAF